MPSYRRACDLVQRAMHRAGRKDSVTIVAISKGQSIDTILSVYEEGCRDFGENRLAEALQKIPHLPKDIRWHFTGTLQKNKVAKAKEHFYLIHSVDTPELALKIGQSTPLLLQVNTSKEPSKHGLFLQEWKEKYASIQHLNVQGLMTIAPLTKEEALIRHCFSSLRKWKEELGLVHLSMGMSHDYLIAIEEGATMLRLGRLVFFDKLLTQREFDF